MASFAAELQVASQRYPVRHCSYEFTQTTSERGRASAKVRHGLVQLTLDVPHDDVLLGWAVTPHKPLAGRVVFFDGKGGPVLETLAWEAGECVGYQEEFASGDANAGAYVCHLTIAAPKLTMRPGGPAAYVSPAARDHGAPAAAGATVLDAALLKAEELASGLVKKVITPAGEVGTEILGVGAAAIARAASLTLGLVLTPTNSRDDPGYAAEWEMYRRNTRHLSPLTPAQLRLAQLERLHEQGTLTPEEEAEFIALLASVKGIHVQRLSELTPKPKHSPIPAKWKEKGGRIDVLSNGDWQYTDWDGNVVVYNGDEPNFDPHQRQQVDIEGMEGNCTSDFDKADKVAPLGPILDDNTWHHKNNLKTMQEVPTAVHRRFTHYGARSIIRKGNAATPVKKAVIRKRKP